MEKPKFTWNMLQTDHYRTKVHQSFNFLQYQSKNIYDKPIKMSQNSLDIHKKLKKV